jgi:hypothetical protein
MINLILISGKARSGKDTLAEQMKSILKGKYQKVLIVHLADLLKFSCKKFWNWNEEKDEHGRSLLQYVGTDLVREINDNYWIDYIKTMLRLSQNEWDYVIIPDCRFVNEIDKATWCDLTTKIFTIRIDRPDLNKLSNSQKKHSSEIDLDNYPYWDYKINNDKTLDDLFITAENILYRIQNQIHRDEEGRFKTIFNKISLSETKG